ncbi:MAG: N-acetylmuramoyl-L-alanine amidase, partial [Jatrophihabitantaceae bacterium]
MRRLIAALAVLAGVVSACSTGGSGGPSSTPPSPQSVVSAVPSTSSAAVRTSTSRATPHRTPTGRTTPHSVTPSATHRSSPTVTFPGGSGPLVVLDPGHNGGNASHPAQINRLVPAGFNRMKPCNTTGTNTNAGYPEHAFNWDVALRTRAILRAHGVRVLMTRSDDTGVGPCVNQRAAIQNTKGVRLAVIIHADGAPSSGHGFHVNEDSRLPDGATEATRVLSHALTVAEHDALLHGSGLTTSTYFGQDGYVKRDDFAGLNLSRVPTTFLELGNMRNAGDAALQTSASGRQR